MKNIENININISLEEKPVEQAATGSSDDIGTPRPPDDSSESSSAVSHNDGPAPPGSDQSSASSDSDIGPPALLSNDSRDEEIDFNLLPPDQSDLNETQTDVKGPPDLS